MAIVSPPDGSAASPIAASCIRGDVAAIAGIATCFDALVSIEALAAHDFGLPTGHILVVSANFCDVDSTASFGRTIGGSDCKSAVLERLAAKAAHQPANPGLLPGLLREIET